MNFHSLYERCERSKPLINFNWFKLSVYKNSMTHILAFMSATIWPVCPSTGMCNKEIHQEDMTSTVI